MTPEPLKNKIDHFDHMEFFPKKDVASAVALNRSREWICTIDTGGRICSSCKLIKDIHTLIDNRIFCHDCCSKHDFYDVIPEGEKKP